jgi:hypothetical protein
MSDIGSTLRDQDAIMRGIISISIAFKLRFAENPTEVLLPMDPTFFLRNYFLRWFYVPVQLFFSSFYNFFLQKSTFSAFSILALLVVS